MKLCILIPIYNHGATLISLLNELAVYQLPCIIIDDGSDAATKMELTKALEIFSWVKIITLPSNKGKGAAMIIGFRAALTQNYTHALQIDADGQHAVVDVSKFIHLSLKHPKAMISGHPIYDYTAPKARVYGRKLTNFWVAIETLSMTITEAMCGFRIYPLQAVDTILQTTNIGSRMEFDIEILVRLFWQGTPIKFISTKIIYPTTGLSHFHMLHDNYRITAIHTRLVFGMLRRIPQLLIRKFQHEN